MSPGPRSEPCPPRTDPEGSSLRTRDSPPDGPRPRRPGDARPTEAVVLSARPSSVACRPAQGENRSAAPRVVLLDDEPRGSDVTKLIPRLVGPGEVTSLTIGFQRHLQDLLQSAVHPAESSRSIIRPTK